MAYVNLFTSAANVDAAREEIGKKLWVTDHGVGFKLAYAPSADAEATHWVDSGRLDQDQTDWLCTLSENITHKILSVHSEDEAIAVADASMSKQGLVRLP
jgi:hypothetical protein